MVTSTRGRALIRLTNRYMKKIILITLLLFTTIALSGCKAKKIEEVNQIKEVNEINLCAEKGGIPIRSIWDGRLKNCLFK